MPDYINALIYAAEEGYKLPRVTIELCAICNGIKFRSHYPGAGTCEHIVSWEEFLSSRFPIKLLVGVIQSLRAQLNDAAPK